MRIRTLAAVFAVLAVTACDRPAEPAGAPAVPAPAASASSYAVTSDVSGYYMPASEVRIGKWAFDHIFVGQAFEFEAWKGADSGTTFAPVMLQFNDATSPMVETELGEARSVTARVLPTRYAVSDDRIEFEGTSTELGPVRFEGRINQGALATSRRNLGDEGVVVTGTLTAGGQTVRDLRLRWWMGD
ncbi:MAG: hypothetical protein PSV23_08160 [Brevundimonas sp.]|uniref:hypothetical protein n=1 Tax=Brevundimonas sp. TaxID=1871086 RepID=UPI002487A737|nr:hypothetical protein [Brevundimonas sp.]MDI1326762.1 hypothetical protein [Brevundimonas sp.]